MYRDDYEYNGPIEEAKKKKNPYEAQAASISTQQQALSQQQQQFAQQQETVGAAKQEEAQKSLSQFEGPIEQSPFYKALLTTGIESTSNAYQSAARGARSRAMQAGYGYNQPAAAGAEDQVAAQGASELATQPNKALLGAAPMTLQAAGETGNLGSTQTGEGVASSGAATGSLSEANTANKSAADIQDMASKRKAGLFKTLAGVGLLAAAPFTGGATLAPGATVLGSGS